VEHRCRALTALLKEFGEIEELHSENSALLWREIRDVRLFDATDNQIWRLSVPPAAGANVVASLRSDIGGRVFYDWGGGLIWLSMGTRSDAGHETVRAAVADTGGHATLIRADADVRQRVPVFEPQATVLKDLSARVKQGFDPNGVLNPGRMVEGE
jgi:glycolate oxidase FAD binding subunit